MTTPSILSTDVSSAVTKVLSVSGFDAQRENVGILVSLYVQYAAGVEATKDETTQQGLIQRAIDELEIVAPCDRVGLRQRLNMLAEARKHVASRIAVDWKNLTGDEIGSDLNIAGRLKDELDEQQPLKEWALRLQNKVRDIDTALALKVLSPEKTSEEETQDKPKNLIEGLQNVIARRLVEQRQKEIEAEGLGEEVVKLGWLTTPLMIADDENLILAERRLDFVLAKITRYQADDAIRAQAARLVEDELNNTPSLKVPMLVEIMKAVFDLSQRQIEQSNRIMVTAKEDVQEKLPMIQIVLDVDRMIRAVYVTYRLSELGMDTPRRG